MRNSYRGSCRLSGRIVTLANGFVLGVSHDRLLTDPKQLAALAAQGLL